MEASVVNRVLVYVQAHLDEDLSLERLSRVAELSPFHFEREFAKLVGETPKRYTQRLRLERAAIRLLLHSGSVLDVALECGFQGHETFTRAFARRFGCSPRDYRTRHRAAHGERRPARERPPESADFELSSTQLCELGEVHLAFLRHLGRYEEVSEQLWDDLGAWALRRRVPPPHVLMGIGHDAPGITSPDKLRFDAAIRIPAPMRMVGRIGHQILGPGSFAVTTHVGSYLTLGAAYAEIFRRLAERRDCRIVGLPVVEVYHTTKIDVRLRVNHTDIYVPVERRAGA